MQKLIKNADIVLMTGNMTNIFFDMEYYNLNEANFKYDTLCKKLNANSKDSLESHGRWVIPNDKSTLKTRLSASSFVTDRKKHNTIQYEINDYRLDEILNTPELDQYVSKYNEVKSILNQSLTFQNAVIKFGSYGDVIFNTKVSLIDISVSAKQYNMISSLLRNIARDLYQEIVNDACIKYIETIENEIDCNEFKQIQFEIENVFEAKEKLKYSINRSMYTISWVHLIYDDDYNDIGNKKLAYEIAFKEEKLDYLCSVSHNAHIYLGWSHTIFFLENNQNKHLQEEINYHLTPIENEFAEWEFIIAMTRNIERLLFYSYSFFESNKFLFIKTTKFKRNINQLFFFIQRIMHSYDNTSITLNQYQAKLMEAQEKKWEINRYYQSYKDKSKSLYNIVDYIIQRKKSVQAKILNGILFIIALLSTIEISNSIYQIISNNDRSQLIFSLGPVFTIILIIFLYNRIAGD